MKHPRSLAVLLAYLWSWEAAGDFKRALDAADEAITRADASPVAPYDDASENLSWIRNQRATLVWRLGRWADAVQEQERAQRLVEQGHINVNQSINLARLYCTLDRPREALAAVAPIGENDVNEYGRMQLEGVRHSAALQLGDQSLARKAMDWMRDHHADAEPSYQRALLEADDMAGAARVLIARLEDPRKRTDALLALQHFADVPETPRQRFMSKQWEALASRADVKAAIAKVGRIEHFALAPE